MMRSKPVVYIFLIALAVGVFLLRKCRSFEGTDQTSNARVDGNRDHGFDRRTSFLEYTQHARCRMQCRQIDETEVEEIMRTGIINYRKSELDARPCPTYALEGMTHDDQHVRIVFAQCDHKTKVVTTIDLEHEWECHCPGDHE